MKNPDEAVKRVLSGLREVEAPGGMERRILEAVRERTSTQSLPSWHRLRWTWLAMPTRPMAAISLAAIFVVALAIPSISRVRRLGHFSAQSKRTVPPVESQTPSASEVATRDMPPPSLSRGTRSGGKPNARRAARVLDSDSVALQGMRAASRPAPPLPLTEQEKLLLRIAHKRDPEELAMLDPEMRAKQDAEGKTEFQRFFEPPTTGDNK